MLWPTMVPVAVEQIAQAIELGALPRSSLFEIPETAGNGKECLLLDDTDTLRIC